jgi:hypothetical protein
VVRCPLIWRHLWSGCTTFLFVWYSWHRPRKPVEPFE